MEGRVVSVFSDADADAKRELVVFDRISYMECEKEMGLNIE